MPDKSALKAELHEKKMQRDGLAKKIGTMRIEINQAQDRIAEIEMALRRIDKEPRVSDHAVLRYLERKMGLDLEAVREEILSGGTLEAIKAGAVRHSRDGCHFLISKEGCVTTVLEQNMSIPYRHNGGLRCGRTSGN